MVVLSAVNTAADDVETHLPHIGAPEGQKVPLPPDTQQAVSWKEA